MEDILCKMQRRRCDCLESAPSIPVRLVGELPFRAELKVSQRPARHACVSKNQDIGPAPLTLADLHSCRLHLGVQRTLSKMRNSPSSTRRALTTICGY